MPTYSNRLEPTSQSSHPGITYCDPLIRVLVSPIIVYISSLTDSNNYITSACASAIVKTVLQAKVFKDTDSTFHDSYAMWNNIELHVGIIAACLPALRPLFAVLLDGAKKASRTVLGSSSAGRQHQYYVQDDSGGGIKLSSLGNGGLANLNKYDVRVTTRSHSTPLKGSRIGGGDSEEELKDSGPDRDSDELFIMSNGQGIMKSVDVTVHR